MRELAEAAVTSIYTLSCRARPSRAPSPSPRMVGGSVDRKHRVVQFCWQSCSLRVLTWVVALSSAAWSSYVYFDRSFRCPEGTVCIEGDRFGKGPPVTPYSEFTEVTNSHAVYRVSALLKTEQSPYQLVQAYQSHFFGKILVIDGALMITERDESNYHESLVHTTLNYLPDARRVLVIGGGDGGTVTQLLKRRRMATTCLWPAAAHAATHRSRGLHAGSGPPLYAREERPRGVDVAARPRRRASAKPLQLPPPPPPPPPLPPPLPPLRPPPLGRAGTPTCRRSSGSRSTRLCCASHASSSPTSQRRRATRESRCVCRTQPASCRRRSIPWWASTTVRMVAFLLVARRAPD